MRIFCNCSPGRWETSWIAHQLAIVFSPCINNSSHSNHAKWIPLGFAIVIPNIFPVAEKTHAWKEINFNLNMLTPMYKSARVLLHLLVTLVFCQSTISWTVDPIPNSWSLPLPPPTQSLSSTSSTAVCVAIVENIKRMEIRVDEAIWQRKNLAETEACRRRNLFCDYHLLLLLFLQLCPQEITRKSTR